MAAAGGHRYLRIHLDARIPDGAAIALLAHELQHAVEIADAMWVVEQKTLATCALGSTAALEGLHAA